MLQIQTSWMSSNFGTVPVLFLNQQFSFVSFVFVWMQLEAGHCDINQTDENGATALHLAALHRCREAVDGWSFDLFVYQTHLNVCLISTVLLEHGARMLLDFAERSPLHYAYDGHKELRAQRVKKHNTAQHKSNLVAQLDMIVFLAQRSNNFIKSLLSVDSADVSDAYGLDLKQCLN
jgi:hypothetical protein